MRDSVEEVKQLQNLGKWIVTIDAGGIGALGYFVFVSSGKLSVAGQVPAGPIPILTPWEHFLLGAALLSFGLSVVFASWLLLALPGVRQRTGEDSEEDVSRMGTVDRSASQTPTTAVPLPADGRAAIKRVAMIALLAVVLGFTMQLLILAVKLAGGGQFPGLRLLADTTQGTTWAVLVCGGVGLGTTMVKSRANLMGILGIVFAPIALAVSKAGEKFVSTLLHNLGPGGLSIPVIGVKALEYGLLGWMLGRMLEKNVERVRTYLIAGLLVGLIFGGSNVFFSYQAAAAKKLDFGAPQLLGTTVNEIVFPIGCSLVIYLGQFLGRHMRVIEEHHTRLPLRGNRSPIDA